MQFEITARCNLKCIHCYNVPEKNKTELSTKKIKSILDELCDKGALFIGFTGGEVLCRKDFFEIAGYARKKGFALRVFTNASLITARIADKIRDIEPFTVEISLYAADPRIHDKITGVAGSYKKTMRAINMLSQRKLNILIKSVIMKENAHEHKKLKAFADSIKARFIYDYVLIPRTDGSQKPLRHCMSDFEIKDLLCKNIKMNTSNKDDADTLSELPEKNQPICGAAKNGASISAYGDVHPCVTWRISLGNLKEKSFKNIWSSSEAEKIRNLTVNDLKYCRDCELFYHCNHCPGMALLETSDSLGLSPTGCRAARLKKEAIDMVYSS